MEERYYHTSESVKEYIKAAEGFNGQHLISQLNKVIPAKSKVLELGSGPGTDYELLAKTHQVVGSDYSEEFQKHLNSHFPDGEFLHLNAATLDTSEKFDAIYSNKVLQHLTQEELVESVKLQAKTLNSNGVICHSFWYGKGSEEFKGMHVNYQNTESVKSLFSSVFNILTLSKYKEFEKEDSIVLIAKKKDF
ncbi:MAG: class I SAM-dependent methyltransferase [Salibacteraceae bacterium]